MNEIWKDIKGYEGFYQISNLGRIKSLERYRKYRGNFKAIVRERILKLKVDKEGYSHVSLSKRGDVKFFKVARLVAQAFIINCNNYPQVNHIDGNKSNDLVSNLEWVTASQNCQHAYDIGLSIPQIGEKHSQVKLNKEKIKDIRFLHKLGLKDKDIAKIYYISRRHVNDIVNRKTWMHI
jgi:hypothetical protein